MDSSTPIAAVFVYGTLKRGECRAKYWPRVPASIEVAAVIGRLHDLGPYPALVPGGDRVVGELWRFDLIDMEETLAVLDRIEGFGQLGEDYYRRVIAECETENGERVAAYVYEFGRPESLAKTPVVRPNASGAVIWHGGGQGVGQALA